MGSLRRGCPEIFRGCLHDHTGLGDIVPFDRNAEPSIGRSPPAGSDQKTFFLFFSELLIVNAYFRCDREGVRRIARVRFDEEDAVDIFVTAIAQRHGGIATGILYVIGVDIGFRLQAAI